MKITRTIAFICLCGVTITRAQQPFQHTEASHDITTHGGFSWSFPTERYETDDGEEGNINPSWKYFTTSGNVAIIISLFDYTKQPYPVDALFLLFYGEQTLEQMGLSDEAKLIASKDYCPSLMPDSGKLTYLAEKNGIDVLFLFTSQDNYILTITVINARPDDRSQKEELDAFLNSLHLAEPS